MFPYCTFTYIYCTLYSMYCCTKNGQTKYGLHILYICVIYKHITIQYTVYNIHGRAGHGIAVLGTCATFSATAPLARTEKVAHVGVALQQKLMAQCQ